jgi:hypothetical protein
VIAMATGVDQIEKLRAARDQQVEARRQLAEALAEPYKKGHTEDMRTAFIDVQATIEAIDRAIADEQHLPSTPKTGGISIKTAPRT